MAKRQPYITTGILPDMVPLRDLKDFKPGDRMFFELGHKINIHNPNYEGNWIRTGRFREISSPESYLESDEHMNNKKYLEHHNIMIIKTNRDESTGTI